MMIKIEKKIYSLLYHNSYKFYLKFHEKIIYQILLIGLNFNRFSLFVLKKFKKIVINKNYSSRTKTIINQVILNFLYKGGSILINLLFVPISIRFFGCKSIWSLVDIIFISSIF